MSRAALAAGLSALWLAESLVNENDREAEYQFDVSQALASRLDDFEDAFDAFASDGFERGWEQFADELRVA